MGGGMSFGAFGGRNEIMQLFDPRNANAIPHAGTFNNNTLTMAAGVAAMGTVLTDDALLLLNQRGDKLRAELNRMCEQHNANVQFTGAGSLLALHATRKSIRNAKDLVSSDDRIVELIFFDLLERGYYIARRGFMALMLPLTDQELDGFKNACNDIFRERAMLWAI